MITEDRDVELLSDADAASVLNVSVTRVRQIRRAPAAKLGTTRGDSISASNLLGLPQARERLDHAKRIAESLSTPALVTDESRCLILSTNQALERLLFRAGESLIGHRPKHIGLTDEALSRRQLTVQQVGWGDGPRQLVILRPLGPDDHQAIPELLTECRRESVEQALAELEQVRGGHWCAEVIVAEYDRLGGNSVDVQLETRPLGNGLVLHRLASRPIAARMQDEFDHHNGLASMRGVQDWFGGLIDGYAKAIANEFMSESCVVFDVRRPRTSPRLIDPGGLRPRTITAVGDFGLPKLLCENEIFVLGPGQPGILPRVMLERRPRVIGDFPRSEDRTQVRQPNYFNAALNSRFGLLQNCIVVPIIAARTTSSEIRAIGAIRLTNLYRPSADGGFQPADPAWAQGPLARVAEMTAVLYDYIRNMMQSETLRLAIEAARENPDFRGVLQTVCENARVLLDFDHVVVWRQDPSELMRLVHYDGVFPLKDVDARIPSAYAERAVRQIEPFPIDTGPQHHNGPIFNGFEAPIKLPVNRPWGTIGFYNSWSADQTNLANVCKSLASIVGLRAAMGDPPRAD